MTNSDIFYNEALVLYTTVAIYGLLVDIKRSKLFGLELEFDGSSNQEALQLETLDVL